MDKKSNQSSAENRLFHWKQTPRERQKAAQTALDSQAARESGKEVSAGVTLADLKPGECGTIIRLLGATQGRLRLLEMGLTPGTHVKVLRAAAFGGPLDVLVRGYQLSLRREEAALVWLGDDAVR